MMLAEMNHIVAPLPWQQSLWDGVTARMLENRLPHALMLRGEVGTGKGQFALALAQRLLCEKPVANTACGHCKGCHLNLVGSHPDFILVEPEDGSKTIKVDQVRDVVDFVSKKPQLDGYRVVVVCPAEAMNLNSSNALLKSLEEPGDKTVLILVSHRLAGVLPTIRSRCQVMDFPIPAKESALNWLNAMVGDEYKSQKLLNVAGGAPMKALQLNDSEWLGERSGIAQQWLAVLSGKRDPIRTAEGWNQYPLLDLVEWLLAWQIDLSKLLVGASEKVVNQDLLPDLQVAAQQLHTEKLFLCHDHLLSVKAMLNSQANPNSQLLLEEILLKWSQAATLSNK